MKLIDMLVEELQKRGGWPDDSDEMCQSQFDCEIYTNSKLMSDFYVGERAEDNGIDNGVTREQYEAALAAKNEGWIEWGGGECPVEKGTLIDVKWRDGRIDDGIPARIIHDFDSPKHNATRWGHIGDSRDIIAYRLHKQKEAEQDKANLNECIGQDAAPAWSGEGLPPVGCFCEVEDLDGMLVYGQGEFGEVIAHVENTAVIRMSYGLGCFEARFLRPILAEAERKRDAAVEIMIQILCSPSQASATAKKIYDAIAAGEIPGVKLED